MNDTPVMDPPNDTPIMDPWPAPAWWRHLRLLACIGFGAWVLWLAVVDPPGQSHLVAMQIGLGFATFAVGPTYPDLAQSGAPRWPRVFAGVCGSLGLGAYAGALLLWLLAA